MSEFFLSMDSSHKLLSVVAVCFAVSACVSSIVRILRPRGEWRSIDRLGSDQLVLTKTDDRVTTLPS